MITAWSADGKRAVRMAGLVKPDRIIDGRNTLTEFEHGFAAGIEYAMKKAAEDVAQATP